MQATLTPLKHIQKMPVFDFGGIESSLVELWLTPYICLLHWSISYNFIELWLLLNTIKKEFKLICSDDVSVGNVCLGVFAPAPTKITPPPPPLPLPTNGVPSGR